MLSQGGSEAPTARHRHTTVLHDNAMWAYGGMTDLQEKSDFWRFDFGKCLIMQYTYKGGFFSERADAFIISSSRQT